MSEPINAVEGLFAETAEGPRLLGSQCRSCGTPYFPRGEVCHNPDCSSSAMEDAPSARAARSGVSRSRTNHRLRRPSTRSPIARTASASWIFRTACACSGAC